MTPANRAPKVSLFGVPIVYTEPVAWQTGYASRLNGPDSFVFRQYEGGGESVTLYLSDEGKTWHRAGCDPIGPALPAPAAKSLGEVAADAWDRHGPYEARWSYVASAVIAAHEAGRGEPVTSTAWAIYDPDTKMWWGDGHYVGSRSGRVLFDDRDEAKRMLDFKQRLVRITTRRRRVVK